MFQVLFLTLIVTFLDNHKIGDITTDLYLAQHIPEPNTDMNWLTYGNMWAKNIWMYNTTFSLTAQDITSLGATGSGISLLFNFTILV